MRTNLQVLRHSSSTFTADRPVLYDPVFDEYRLISAGPISDRGVITWCPWCGLHLPPSRRENWFVALKDHGLNPDDVALPHRFRTNEWWTSPADNDGADPAEPLDPGTPPGDRR
jgi:hypothetical protein